MPVQHSYVKGQQGARPEFEELVASHYAALYRFAMSLTGTETDAADLVQETFLTWARKGHQLQDPSRAKGWLFTTLHRLFLESQRRVIRFPHQELSAAENYLPPLETDMVRRLDGVRILELLNEVDVQYKAAVALFYLEDLSYQEIAELLEIPLGTVKSRIARGVSQLREIVTRTTHRTSNRDEGRHT